MAKHQYTEDSIKSLDWKEHIRIRPGMYIGKLGDGSSHDDGIYVLLKEILDNSMDEFVMGFGKTIEISVRGQKVTVRDYGRGIPLGKVIDCVSKINTGGKYDSKAFQKSVGLNGVGLKAVNALSQTFTYNDIFYFCITRKRSWSRSARKPASRLSAEHLTPHIVEGNAHICFSKDKNWFQVNTKQ